MNSIDTTSDALPTRELQANSAALYPPKKSISETKERQLVSVLARKDLEDKYLRLREDHMDLKMLSRKQEEKLKQMATKLLRLFNDKKKIIPEDQTRRSNIETFELIEELRAKISDLERTNQMLKNKLLVTKQQLQTTGRKQSSYENIKPRVQTGLLNHSIHQQKTTKAPVLSKQSKSAAPSPQPVLAQPRYGHSLLEEARIEKRELEGFVASLQEQMKSLKNEKENLTDQIFSNDREFERQRNLLQSEISDLKNAQIEENAELIRLEREAKDKSNKLVIIQGKYTNLEQMLQQIKSSNENTLNEMEILTEKLKEEQERNSSLRNKIRDGEVVVKSLSEKERLMTDMVAENQILKETQEKLLLSTFDSERERRFRLKEKEYQIKISQLEALTKADILEKNQLLDKLSHEKDENDTLQAELKEWRINCYKHRELYEELAEKMRIFSKDGNVDMEELKEALILVKSRQDMRDQHQLDFLEKVEKENGRDLKNRIFELETSHSETVSELEKTRGMLKMQHQLNKDYQQQIQIATEKMNVSQKDCDMRLQEYAQMLDTKTQRISKLEAQLKDVAYGTRQFRIKPIEEPEACKDSFAESEMAFELEKGQNVVEIHIGKLLLTKDGLEYFQNMNPQMFITIEFFEFELQTTPVLSGKRPTFNSTLRYIVAVDDFFLHHIQKETAKIELHQALGTDFSTIASGRLRMNDILGDSKDRMHGKLKLINLDKNLEFAILEYWICLRVPMDHALRLYKERSKALGYIKSNNTLNHTSQLTQPDQHKGMNELTIKVLHCMNLKVQPGQQPNSYAVYRFFTFADHDTEIVTNSTSPVFNDVQTYPVLMSHELDHYLKTAMLDLYIFNDKETKSDEYMGLARIPLTNLSLNKSVSGTFELHKGDAKPNGTVDVSLQWLSTYSLPEATQSKLDTVCVRRRSESSSIPPRMTSLSTPTNVSKMVQLIQDTTEVSLDRSADGSSDFIEDTQSREKQRSVSFNENTSIRPYEEDDCVKEPTPVSSASRMEYDSQAQAGATSTVQIIDQETDKPTEDLANNYESDEALLVEELRRTVEVGDVPRSPINSKNIAEDTIFGDEMSERTSNNDENDLVQISTAKVPAALDSTQFELDQMFSGAESITTSDSEGVVVSSVEPKAVSRQASSSNTVAIEVGSLTLYENAAIYKASHAVQLYVAYRFLDEDPALLETPDSLPLPPANKPIHYNFKKIFHVDKDTHLLQHQLLMSMLMPDHPSDGRLFFNIVTEPVNGEECEDAGVAIVDLVQILKDSRDVIDEDIEVVDFEGELIGSLNVTVEAIKALQSFYD